MPHPIDPAGFNPNCVLPHGLTIRHIQTAMSEFTDFLGFINAQLNAKGILRFECMLMPANFSSLVGEFMVGAIPKQPGHNLVKNAYHNGHPDLIPKNYYRDAAGNPITAVQHGTVGIEVKGSRYLKGWQGHNAEDTWLMVFVFDSNRPVDTSKGIAPRPFRFVKVVGAELTKLDWIFSGRSETSRRTITASVTRSGYEKMSRNWIYLGPALR